MAAVTGTVGAEGHGLASECPAEIAVAVTASGEVGQLSVLDVHESDIAVVPSAFALVSNEKVLAVRAPFEFLVTVGVGVVHTLEKALLLLTVHAAYHQLGAVAKEGDPFAVRRNCRLEAGLAGLGEEFLFDFAAQAEILVILVLERGSPHSPVAVALGRVVEDASVRSEADSPLLVRSVGDAARCLEVHAGNIYVSMEHERELIALVVRAERAET